MGRVVIAGLVLRTDTNLDDGLVLESRIDRSQLPKYAQRKYLKRHEPGIALARFDRANRPDENTYSRRTIVNCCERNRRRFG